MNCDELKNVASRYLAGESDEAEAVAVENHLAICGTCAAAPGNRPADRRQFAGSHA